MRKRVLGLMGFCFIFFICITEKTYAEDCHSMIDEWFGNEVNLMSIDTFDVSDVEKVVEEYFKIRTESLYNQEEIEESFISEDVLSVENMRRLNIIDMQKRMNISISDADNNINIDSIEEKDDIYYVTLYEWVFYNYDDLDVDGYAVNVSGFGVEHELVLDSNLCIISDWYDESDLTGICTLEKQIEDDSGISLMSAADDSITLMSTMYSGYDPDAAATYADKYTYTYNTEYYNFNSLGGDCANFTSQSIYAGGMPQVVGNAYGLDCWYYITSLNRSATWTGAAQLRTWMANNRGNLVNSPNASQIYKGSPVFYDWDNNGSWDHAVICVGVNSEGIPVIDSHNADKYHIKYNYGSESTVCSTVQLTNSSTIKPQAISITTPLYNNNIENDVEFNFDYKNASWAAIVIIKDGVNKHVETVTGKTTYTHKFTEPGIYKVQLELWSGDYCDTKNCEINVYSDRPSNVSISTNTVFVQPNTSTEFTFTQKDASYWYFVVSKDSVREYVELVTGKYSTTYTFNDEGSYVVEIQAANDCGWTMDSINITVSDEYIATSRMQYDEHIYLLFGYPLTWYESKELCEQMGGHLATITSEAEYNELIDFINSIPTSNNYYIGGTDENSEGNWEWVTGEEWSYNDFWNTGEPNNSDGNEHYMALYYGQAANDLPITRKYGFICEIENICGDNLTWNFDEETGLLEISGIGEMYDYTEDKNAPWYVYAAAIEDVSFENGITSIDRDAFAECVNLSDIYFESGQSDWNSILKKGTNTYFDNASIHFAKEDVAVESISIDKSFINLMPDETMIITAKVLPEDATNKNVIWTTSDENVAEITEIVYGDADNNGVVDEADIDFMTNVTIEQLQVDERTKLATDIDDNGDINAVDILYVKRWLNGQDSAENYPKKVMITSKNVGRATITVTTEDGGFEASCEIFVDKPITSTTYKTLTSTYKFYIECEQALNDECLAVACYDESGRIVATRTVECDGDTSYTASVPIDTNIKYAKVFLWNGYSELEPMGRAEIVEMN